MHILTPEAIPLIRPILEEDMAENIGKIKFISIERILAIVTARVTEKRGLVLVDDKIKPKGLLIAQVMPALITDDIWCGILFLFVSTAARGQGIGKKMLESLPLVASTLGATKIMATSHFEDGEHAKRIYDDLGYTKVEIAHVLEL